MIEVVGNLWEYDADVRVITTNRYIKRNGEAVMGRGCAAEAVRFFPWLPAHVGKLIKMHDMRQDLPPAAYHIVSKPDDKPWDLWGYHVKHNWWEMADFDLIQQGAEELAKVFRNAPDTKIILPRPGCGNGGLLWRDVKPLLKNQLDDKFFVIDYGG